MMVFLSRDVSAHKRARDGQHYGIANLKSCGDFAVVCFCPMQVVRDGGFEDSHDHSVHIIDGGCIEK